MRQERGFDLDSERAGKQHSRADDLPQSLPVRLKVHRRYRQLTMTGRQRTRRFVRVAMNQSRR